MGKAYKTNLNPTRQQPTTMDIPPFAALTTERLHLRKLEFSDWEMICYLRSDPAVNQFVNRPTAETKAAAETFIQSIQKRIENGKIFYWAIARQSDPRMMGSICLWNFSTDYTTGELGYDLSPAFQGKGFMQESLEAVLRFGFDALSLNQIEAFTHHQNGPSIRLLERNGFLLQPSREDPHNAHNRIYVRSA